MGSWTVGKYVLTVLVLIVAFPAIMEALNFIYGAVTGLESVMNSSFPGVHSFASLVDSFVWNLNSWLGMVLISSLGVVVLIFISLLYYAFESKWR